MIIYQKISSYEEKKGFFETKKNLKMLKLVIMLKILNVVCLKFQCYFIFTF